MLLNEDVKHPEPNIKLRFGQAMKQRRRELGLSQEALAERAGLHRTYIADVERGKRNLALENIEKIVLSLETTISAFFAKYDVDLDKEQS